MHDVFVSYSETDKATADAIVASLESSEIRCWIAQRDITPGTSWSEAIVEAIASSKVMVLVLSANSNASRQVIREVERAVASGVMILPFRIEDVDPTGAMAYFLGTEHWLDAVTPPMQRHIDRLAATLAVTLAGKDVSVPMDQPPSVPVRRTKAPRWVWGATAAVVALLAGAIGAAVVGSGNTATPTTASSGAVASTPVTEVVTPTAKPVSLVEVGTYLTSQAANGFDIDGNFLALANDDAGLIRMSVADPANPLPMAEYSLTGAENVALAGDFAYVIGGGRYARFFMSINLDGSGSYFLPDEPSQAHTSSIYNIVAAGDYVYLAGHNFVGVIYVGEPTEPVLVFSWEPVGQTGNPADVFIDGDIGYFSAGWEGMYVFDLTDPGRPVEIGSLDTANWVIDVVVSGDIAYLTLGESGIATVDVSDPSNPRFISRLDLPAFASPLAVADGFAFIGLFDHNGGGASVAIIDVRDPSRMSLIESFGSFELVSDIEVSNGHLFLIDESRGLFVYEIVTP